MPIFDFNSSAKHNAAIVRELSLHLNSETYHHEGGDNPEWAVAQVELLTASVSKTKHLDNLLKAVIDENPLTPCCPATTKKSIGEHVYIYSIKLFRFSFVRNGSRLKSATNCQYPPAKRADLVCINPYHYDMIKPHIGIPPVHVDTEKIQHGGVIPQKIMDHCYLHMGEEMRGQGPPTAFVSGDEMSEHIDNAEAGIFNRPTDFFMPDHNAPTRHQLFSPDMIQQRSPGSGRSTASPGSPNSFLTNDDRDPLDDSEPMDTGDFVERPRTLAAALPPEFKGKLQLPLRVVKTDVAYTEPEHWLSVTYYERLRRIGAPVDCISPYVLIDGFTKPYNTGRICLGYFSNPSRDIGTSRALLYMGRGCRLYYLGGEVFLENLGQQPIYVQSPNCNQRHGWHAATVVQVPTGCNLKIFSYAEFSSQLAECVKYGFDAVYALARLCTIRMSFVKGWGSAFRRQQVTNTPIWVEAHLNGALEWVDNVLSKMGCPSRVCSSFS